MWANDLRVRFAVLASLIILGLFFAWTFVDTSSWHISDHPIDRILALFGQNTTGSFPSHRPTILILQYNHSDVPLHRASIHSHRLYAARHGYEYRVDNKKFAKPDRAVKPADEEYRIRKESTMNKMYLLREVIQAELEKGDDCVGWIFWTDMDTLVLDPTIPIDALLPPSSIHPQPYLMCAQDDNGLNNGVMILRTHVKILLLIEHIIANFEIPHDGIWNDQCQLGRILVMDDHFHDIGIVEHFYEIPKVWFNAYRVDEGEEGEPRMQIHLVDRLKRVTDWSSINETCLEGFQSDQAVWEESRRRTEEVGEAWWKVAKGGLGDMKLYWDC